jgi:hypothetical protein
VISKDSADWWRAKNAAGTEGDIPFNFVRPLDDGASGEAKKPKADEFPIPEGTVAVPAFESIALFDYTQSTDAELSVTRNCMLFSPNRIFIY